MESTGGEAGAGGMGSKPLVQLAAFDQDHVIADRSCRRFLEVCRGPVGHRADKTSAANAPSSLHKGPIAVAGMLCRLLV